MKINNNFMLKKVAGEYMIIPTGNNNVNFSKIFNINETGAFIFEKLKDGKNKEEILELMSKEYNASKDILKNDIEEFIDELKKRGIYND